EVAHRQGLGGGGGPRFITQLNFASLTVAIGDLLAAQQIAQLCLRDRKICRLENTIVDPGAQRLADYSTGWIAGKYNQRDRSPVRGIPDLSKERRIGRRAFD